jgi:hypothetical protein
MARLVRYLVVLLLAGALTATTLVLAAPGLADVFTGGDAGDSRAIDLDPLSERSVVLAADGSTIGVLRDENRVSVPLNEVPDVVVDTVLAIEDEDFYLHDGVNLRATMRALLTNVEAGDIRQGGSTITQQLVKNALLSPEQNISRKIEEAVLARRLEDTMSKDEILERYLNTVFLGNRAYGIQAASERYFNKPVQELGQAEAAFLAGLIRNPVGYDPLTDRRRPGTGATSCCRGSSSSTSSSGPRPTCSGRCRSPPRSSTTHRPATTSSRRCAGACSRTSGWARRCRSARTSCCAAASASAPPSTRGSRTWPRRRWPPSCPTPGAASPPRWHRSTPRRGR